MSTTSHKDPSWLAHMEWLGYVQPVGLVVSVPGLLAAQAHVNRNIAPEHQRFLACLPRDANGQAIPEIRDFAAFTESVLGWEKDDLTPFPANGDMPADLAELEVHLPEYNETLRPTHVIRELKPKPNQSPWAMHIQCLPDNTDLDKPIAAHDRGWVASPQNKFERLLRETGVPAGLLVTSKAIRLVYAPRGENSGYATFSIPEMVQVAGRPIFAALHMLLCSERLFSLPEAQRLPAILAESRKYQNTVSAQLAEQVLAALYELLRGFQAANNARHGELLRKALADDPDKVYSALLTVLMRIVFVLFAEDRNLLSADPIYANNYSITGLFNRLRADAGRHPDTMDLRYGAWAQLLTLFRLIHGGGSHAAMRIPGREGFLFDPDRYPFLEGRVPSPAGTGEGGRTPGEGSEANSASEIPRVSDGVVWRVLSNLLILDGERLSYRMLGVEEIGSVYQTIMGFKLEIATGQTIALKGKRKYKGAVAAPICIDLDELLATKPGNRKKWLQDQADQKLEGKLARVIEDAASIPDLLAALERKIDRDATPSTVPAGGLLLQPTDERRRSGSHYTPRSFTEPIVRKTLEPILRSLCSRRRQSAPISDHGIQRRLTSAATEEVPTPEQILALKIADIAVGSAAFLVETCRQLADQLVKAWHHHSQLPVIPPDEDEVLFAMRLIAQRCLYGVDRNPMATDLAKLSLWLATLAKDHPFTFLDHAIRSGDSLVGLTRRQIETFTWKTGFTTGQLWEKKVREYTAAALRERQNLLGLGDDYGSPQLKREKLEKADELLDYVRFIGDAAVCAFFSADKDKVREAKRQEFIERLTDPDLRKRPIAEVKALRTGNLSPAGADEGSAKASGEGPAGEHSKHPLTPFHWDIEFPEVFDRENPGFDGIVGNPPFGGHVTVTEGNKDGYTEYLRSAFTESGGKCDAVAFFFRRAFEFLRDGAALGLVATKTVGQGDTRSSGLRWICMNNGHIYSAKRRLKWPGQAAVIVSVVHIFKGEFVGERELDSKLVPIITAYLFHAGGHADPARLDANRGRCFQGSVVRGMGFTFDDTDTKGVATSLAEMHRLIGADPRNAELIFPFIGGEEVNDSPTHKHHRFIINFGEMEEADAKGWTELFELVSTKVLPERTKSTAKSSSGRIVEQFWQYGHTAKDLYAAIKGLPRVLVISQVCGHCTFAYLPNHFVYSHALNVFAFHREAVGCVLHSRVHECWARFFGSSMKDDLRYTPTDCFETFPFPVGFETNTALEAVGREYYEFRAALMVRNNEGLTKTYNRFHDREERSPDILKLRELHAAMDAAVLAAYGWANLLPQCQCEFLLDYEDDEDDEEETGGRKKRKPWRYRWPDDVRDEVLARLLKLNAERAEQEKLTGQAVADAAHPLKRQRIQRKKVKLDSKPGAVQGDLLPPLQGEYFT